MTTLNQPPQYLALTASERGHSLGLDFETYRHLAHTALAITQDRGFIMGIYRIEQGCALDIFALLHCLTIAIEEQLSLWICPLDAPLGSTVCRLQLPNTPQGWRKLLHSAREEIHARFHSGKCRVAAFRKKAKG